MSKIKVLVIDDSALTRSVLGSIINMDNKIEVVGTAIDPIIAIKKIQSLKPDVITLDLFMPRMDGLTFLKKIMRTRPLPVIVISGNTPKASLNAIKALEHGALEIIEKPDISTPEKLKEVSEKICEAIKMAYESKEKQEIVNTFINTVEVKRQYIKLNNSPSSAFYVIGSSTGGPDLLKKILLKIESNHSGIVIAQHMPAMFTKSFASRLNRECSMEVVEAQQNERIEKGKAIILPGDYHGIIEQDHHGYYITLSQAEKVNRHRPSVDVLFNSAAKVAGNKVTGIILTGMGDDGAKGLLNLYEKGAKTIAQDEQSSVVFGMPKRAIALGGAMYVLTPNQIIDWINKKN